MDRFAFGFPPERAEKARKHFTTEFTGNHEGARRKETRLYRAFLFGAFLFGRVPCPSFQG